MPLVYAVPAFKTLRLAGIGHCYFRISDGAFFLNGRQTASFSHPEEPYVTINHWQLVLLLYPGEVMVSGTNHTFEPGTVMVLPPATPVVLRFQADSLHLAAHFALDPSRSDKALGEVQALTTLEPTVELPKFRTILEFASEAQHSNLQRAGEFVNELLRRLIQRSANVRPGEQAVQPQDHHPTVRKAMAWFEIHLSKPIRVTDLAGACGITRRHLFNLFKQDLGVSVSRYMRQRRARRAHLLLTETDRPIKRIASDVGIRDIAHFSRIMREEYGASPRRLRAKLKGG